MTQMTDDEARVIVDETRARGSWVATDSEHDLPRWETDNDGRVEIYLDGHFTKETLLALVQLYPKT